MQAAATLPVTDSGRAHGSVTAAPDRTLTVTATYLLSEEGRKASLLAGGDGRAVQELRIEVPASRLHLVSVDANGVARLKLRPRYQSDDERGVIRLEPLLMEFRKIFAGHFFDARDGAGTRERIAVGIPGSI